MIFVLVSFSYTSTSHSITKISVGDEAVSFVTQNIVPLTAAVLSVV